MKRKLIRKTCCLFDDPNCTTYYYDNGDVECIMYQGEYNGEAEDTQEHQA
jgi:hypothetical protein